MQKYYYCLSSLIGLFFSCQAQNDTIKNAIGLRFGNNHGLGLEISYQKKITPKNRLELDFGVTNDNHTDAIKISGIYQWYWNIEKELDWFAGFGSGIGAWNTNDNYNNGYASDNGVFFVLNGDAGIEYNFKEIPILLAIDLRPEYVFNNYEKDDFGMNFGLGIRYKFK
jgi:hemolysin activation/secretion protein